LKLLERVAPEAGVWSRPAGARGLKLDLRGGNRLNGKVAPRGGARIETAAARVVAEIRKRRAPRGRAD